MRKRPYIPVELDAKAKRVKDDPDAFAVAGAHVLGGIADENYARAILSGMDHYTAKMVSRKDAGFKVDKSARIGNQSNRDRFLIDQLKQRYELEDLRMRASKMKAENPSQKRMAGIVLAALAGGAGTNEIIEYLQGPTIEETEYYR